MSSNHQLSIEDEFQDSKEVQDEANARPNEDESTKGPTGIDDLPNEVLLKILRKLPQLSCDICSFVSQKWEQIVSNGIGFNLEPNDDTDLIAKFGFNRCIFRETLQPIPSFKIPLLVRKIWFTGLISTENFNKLLLPLQNLQELKTNIQAIAKIDEFPPLSFPELKEFTLTFPKYSKLTCKRLANSIGILEALDCPKLENLNLVGIPMVRSQEGNVIVPICNLIEKSASLKKLLLNLQEGRLRSFDEGLRPPMPLPVQVFSSSNIAKYYLECSCTRDPIASRIPAIFNSLLNQLTTLEEIYLNSLIHLPLPVQLITTNQATLISIELNVLEGILDCNIFRDCSRLTVLTLVGRSMDDWFAEFIGPDIQQITHADALPVSLKSLRIADFLVLTEDTEFMALRLPQLLLLELVNIGENDGFGVSLQTLNQMYLNKSIKSIRIGLGVSELSLLQPPPELAFTAALFLRLSDRQRNKFNLYLEGDDSIDGDEDGDGRAEYAFGIGSLGYFRENSMTFITGEANSETALSYKFHDDRLCFNPRFGIEDLIDDGEDWFDDDDDDDDDDDEDENLPPLGFDFIHHRVIEEDDSQTEVPWPREEDNDDDDQDEGEDDDNEEATTTTTTPAAETSEITNTINTEYRNDSTANIAAYLISEIGEYPSISTRSRNSDVADETPALVRRFDDYEDNEYNNSEQQADNAHLVEPTNSAESSQANERPSPPSEDDDDN